MAAGSDSRVLEGGSPNVDIQVTTDVCLTKTNCESPDHCDETKITIVTDLNAVIKRTHSTNKYDGGGESAIEYPDDIPTVDDSFNQPVVRRSKKCTRLNKNKNIETFKESEKFQINRTILLPYKGCTYLGNEPTNKETFVKSSKSLGPENILNDNTPHAGFFKSKPLGKPPSFFNYPKEHDQYVKGAYLSFHPSDNFEISFSQCGSDSLLNSPRYINHHFVSPYNLHNEKLNPQVQHNIMKKGALYKNIDGFDKEIYPPHIVNYPVKATRNVSILHRPRTREKATSTTSLCNDSNLKQSLHNSIKGMLLPYMTPGKEFPSEIVLQLATKKEIIESKKDRGNLIGVMKFGSDEYFDNLLLPVTSSQQQKKRNKWNIFGKFLSKSNNKKSRKSQSENICNDLENVEKEIYYPSIVEVRTKKKTKTCEF